MLLNISGYIYHYNKYGSKLIATISSILISYVIFFAIIWLVLESYFKSYTKEIEEKITNSDKASSLKNISEL